MPTDESDGGEQFGDRALAARHALSARRRKTIGQKKVAEVMGVAAATVSSWETGGKEPPLDTIRQLARVLGVHRAWLAFGDGEMEAKLPSLLAPEDEASEDEAPQAEASPGQAAASHRPLRRAVDKSRDESDRVERAAAAERQGRAGAAKKRRGA